MVSLDKPLHLLLLTRRPRPSVDGTEAAPAISDWSAGEATKFMTIIGHVFIPLNREHDGAVPMDDDQAHFESLPVPLALWEPFEQCLSKHLSELTEGQIDRDEKFWFEAAHVNAIFAVVEAGGSHRRAGPAQLAHVACRFRPSRR